MESNYPKVFIMVIIFIIDIMNENTTIAITQKTKLMLDALGGKSDTYQDIISHLLNHYHKCVGNGKIGEN